MKTEKYAIQFFSIDHPLSKHLTISKKDYLDQIAFLEGKIKELASAEYQCTKMENRYENDQIIETVTRYSIGTGDTVLIKYECKPGYHFKTGGK